MNNQDSLLEQIQGSASSLLEIVADLRAGEMTALQRLQSQVMALSADTNRLEAVFESPIYLGG
jgi:hypothetical protein